MSALRVLAAPCLSLFLCSAMACTSVPVRLESSRGNIPPGREGRPIQARACGFQLLLLIPIGINSRQQRAYRALERQAPNEVIRQISVKERWTYAFVGTVYCTEFSAYAYRAR